MFFFICLYETILIIDQQIERLFVQYGEYLSNSLPFDICCSVFDNYRREIMERSKEIIPKMKRKRYD